MLDYPGDGRVVRVSRGKDDDFSVEHYWLCGPCMRLMILSLRPTDRSPSEIGTTDEFYFRDVLRPERRSNPRPAQGDK